MQRGKFKRPTAPGEAWVDWFSPYFDPTFHRRDSYISILMSGLLRVDGSGLDAVTHLALLGVENVGNGALGLVCFF